MFVLLLYLLSDQISISVNSNGRIVRFEKQYLQHED